MGPRRPGCLAPPLPESFWLEDNHMNRGGGGQPQAWTLGFSPWLPALCRTVMAYTQNLGVQNACPLQHTRVHTPLYVTLGCSWSLEDTEAWSWGG